jgi:serine/threonine protein phosphatase 1
MTSLFVLGDIHGCSTALARLLEAIDPQSHDTVVTLGDYVDRGNDGRGVLDQLIDLESRCHLVPLLGNHEEMLLANRDTRLIRDQPGKDEWIDPGLELFAARHFAFLDRCRAYFESNRHVFLHANYQPDVPLDQLDGYTLRWLSLRDYVPPTRHCTGKIAIVGHTPQEEVLDLGYLKCIDTGCCLGGWLTALEVNSSHLWQVNERGALR